ncbi:hypothetical protein PVAP13_4NG211300 [Panicum virgatum]|uniref:Uncharacterized protein n=1 Tax=Panicum virgatum TaxID=38727 RepID=A0A8T0T7H1_PANVG|nr:hypothetical protein PVAP13_4NG211300 [Panicum virgatum]
MVRIQISPVGLSSPVARPSSLLSLPAALLSSTRGPPPSAQGPPGALGCSPPGALPRDARLASRPGLPSPVLFRPGAGFQRRPLMASGKFLRGLPPRAAKAKKKEDREREKRWDLFGRRAICDFDLAVGVRPAAATVR